MPPPKPKSKSKQVLEYLYRYAIEKGTSEVIEAVVPYGKIGMILWEVGHNVYEIMANANEEDRLAILTELQEANQQEIERLSDELSNDPNVIYPIALSEDERKAVARGIYQTLRQIPKGKSNPQQILQSINQGLFAGRNVLSVQNVNASHAQSVGSAVVKTLVNGSGLGLGQRQKVQFLGQYPVINGFEIKGVLGEGAYARVYLANEQLGNGKWRTCALKVGVLESEERFKREVQNMQLVDHPHILRCWNTGRFQEQGVNKYWISMPNMGGLTLEHLILGNALDLETKLLILMQMADGLEVLHQKKIVHRDLKPSNCLISSDFELKISDFGLSKDLNNKIDSSQSRNADAIGTPAYMSPENIDGNIGFYSDVWAFGIIAFELLSGNLPWGREIKPLVLIGNIQHKDIDVRKQLAPFKLPSGLVDIIDRCLKRDTSQRYRDGAELKSAFYRIAKEERNRLRHNRFKESWRILIEKNLISSFVVQQVENGVSEFKLEAFLSMPDVAILPLALDQERLGSVLDVISQVSREIQLGEVLRRQVSNSQLSESRARLEREKDAEIERVDQDMAQALAKIPPADIARMLSKLAGDSARKKDEVDKAYVERDNRLVQDAQKAKDMLDERKATIEERLKREIAEELKDYDQMIADRKKALEAERDRKAKEERDRVERDRIEQEQASRRRKNLMVLGAILLLACGGGIYVWNEDRLEKERIAERDRLEKERIAELKERIAEQDMLEKELTSKICETNSKACQVYKKSGVMLVKIKGGSFNDEKPIHGVSVEDFYMSKTEVTVGQYRKCVDVGVCSEPNSCDWGTPNWTNRIADKENHPINCVDWKQARVFAKWIGGDLPSEAQWEHASRSGGRDIEYPWGNAYATCKYAVMGWGCGRGGTWEVCSKTGGNTTQGLCDMGGNVWEWVLDEWHDSYSGAPSDDIGWCSDRGCDGNTSALRVVRGGGWTDYAPDLRSAYRYNRSPGDRTSYLGFRVSDLVP